MSVQRTVSRPAFASRSTLHRISAIACLFALAPGLSAAAAKTAAPNATTSRSPDQHSSDMQGPEVQGPEVQGPPPVRLFTSSLTLAVHPYTSCWTSGNAGMCYDGIPPSPLPSLGGTSGPVKLSFARDRWHFQVSVIDKLGDRSRVDLVRTSPREWRFALGPLADGRYRAEVFGNGPQGDVVAAFAFTL